MYKRVWNVQIFGLNARRTLTSMQDRSSGSLLFWSPLQDKILRTLSSLSTFSRGMSFSQQYASTSLCWMLMRTSSDLFSSRRQRATLSASSPRNSALGMAPSTSLLSVAAMLTTSFTASAIFPM